MMKGVGGRRWGLGIGVFFTLLLIPAGVQLAEGTTGGHRVLVLSLLIAYGLGYLVLPSVLWCAALWVRLAGMAYMTAVGVAFIANVGLGAMPLMAYAIGIGAMMLPPKWAIGTCGAVVAGFALAAEVEGEAGSLWGPWAGLLSITVALLLMGMLMRSNRSLQRAQHELAAMAVTQERERVARDLHDVLGHTLTSLAVKASLARRLLGKGLAEQAAAEISDVERQAREALAEVRATVSGYREASLAAEVAGARVALEAGQIEAQVSGDLDGVPPRLREIFAFVVREGVTNVIRHSGSTSCSIHIGPSYVEVVDTGGPAVTAAPAGNGLSGMRQRLEAVGGSLSAGPVPGGGFRIRAEVVGAQ